MVDLQTAVRCFNMCVDLHFDAFVVLCLALLVMIYRYSASSFGLLGFCPFFFLLEQFCFLVGSACMVQQLQNTQEIML
jgi:hypothetical protein